MKRRTILLVVALCVLVWASLGTVAAAASPMIASTSPVNEAVTIPSVNV